MLLVAEMMMMKTVRMFGVDNADDDDDDDDDFDSDSDDDDDNDDDEDSTDVWR